MSSLDNTSGEVRKYTAGREFEDQVYWRLRELFADVQRNRRLEGSSGVRWNVDFMIDDSLLIEASTQKVAETKIDSTFLKFTDIVQKEPHLKGALLFEKFHIRQRRRSHRKVFPTSAYRTMLGFGFAILTIDDIAKLVRFNLGTLDSREASSFPTDFTSRSLEYDRGIIGSTVLQILSKGPASYGELVRAVGKKRRVLVDTIRRLPQVSRVGNFYGLSEDEIYRWLATKRVQMISSVLRRRVLEWKAQLFLKIATSKGSYKTAQFAVDLGVPRTALNGVIHLLKCRGLIRRVDVGTWAPTGTRDGLSIVTPEPL